MPYLSLATSAVARAGTGRRAWVAAQDGQLQGLLVARPRAGRIAWDVEHLYVPVEDERVGVELLERACQDAAAHGVRRVFLETPAASRGLEIARRGGFERYTAAGLWLLRPPFKVEKSDLFEARPRLSADEHDLFHLYTATVPAPVRAAEAMTLEEWAGLHRGDRPWRPSLSGTRQQFVWELGASVVGWMQITFGQRSQYLELLIHPRYEEASEKLLRYALLQASPKAPVYATAREYQAPLGSALQRSGFQQVASHDLFVRMLAVRVPQPALARAKLASG